MRGKSPSPGQVERQRRRAAIRAFLKRQGLPAGARRKGGNRR